MSYVNKVLRPHEQIIMRGKLHWVIYLDGIGCLLFGIVCLLLAFIFSEYSPYLFAVTGFFILVGALSLIRAWFQQWITEIAVTNLRVIYKKGFIKRHTAEMNMDKIESVTVDQSIFGRLLGFGSIHVLGTGEGIEHLHKISSPLDFRNSITAR